MSNEGNEPEIPLESLLDMEMPEGWEEEWRMRQEERTT